jgi:hypothetical protein
MLQLGEGHDGVGVSWRPLEHIMKIGVAIEMFSNGNWPCSRDLVYMIHPPVGIDWHV